MTNLPTSSFPMKKILLLFFFSLLLQFRANAQFNIQAGYTFYPLKAPGFQTFFNSYNAYNSYQEKTPFKSDFPTASGWQWRVGYKLPKDEDEVHFYYNSSTGVNHLVTHNNYEFINGEKRKLTLKCRDWTTDVALGVEGKFLYAAVVGSVVLKDNKLYSSYVFSDGTESFGLEHYLNGIFDAFRLTGGYGVEVGVGIKDVKVVGKMHRVYKPFYKDGSTYLNYYDDLADFKTFDALSNNYPTQYFPADYKYYSDHQFESETANNFVYINDYGWEYTIAIQVMLRFKND